MKFVISNTGTALTMRCAIMSGICGGSHWTEFFVCYCVSGVVIFSVQLARLTQHWERVKHGGGGEGAGTLGGNNVFVSVGKYVDSQLWAFSSPQNFNIWSYFCTLRLTRKTGGTAPTLAGQKLFYCKKLLVFVCYMTSVVSSAGQIQLELEEDSWDSTEDRGTASWCIQLQL